MSGDTEHVDEPGAEARSLLEQAMVRHAGGDVDGALETARRATEIAPRFAEAHAYLGNTLVTRRRRFADGLAALDRAVELAPDDAAVLYTAGWCREFVANALERPRRSHQPVEQDAGTLYARARDILLRALAADPEEGLRGDIEDILDVIASATGEPWDESLVERVPPRER